MWQDMRQGALLLVAISAVAACGGGGGGGNGNNPVVTIAKATSSGDAQTDTIGAPLAAPLRVLVQEDGAPKAGATVTWSVLTGGGQLSSTTSQTGADGIATINWMLGTTAGAQTARAALSGATGSPVGFTATATPGLPAQLAKQAGDNQTTVLSSNFGTPLSVKVSDRAGNGVPGVTVTWTVTGGPGTIGTPTTVTDAQGLASVTLASTGSAGGVTVSAAAAGVALPVTFGSLNVANASRLVHVGVGVVFTSARNGSANPAVDTIQAGQSVLFLSLGGTHTVESTDGPPPAFTESPSLTAGQTFTLGFGAAGTFRYDCGIHGTSMSGRIVVQ